MWVPGGGNRPRVQVPENNFQISSKFHPQNFKGMEREICMTGLLP